MDVMDVLQELLNSGLSGDDLLEAWVKATVNNK